MRGREMEAGKLVVIAMKGHPGTGKTTLARAIASALKCPLLDKDDIKDCTAHIHRALANATPHSAGLLNDLSYAALFRVAATQLSLGLRLVIDSPLSRPAHFDRIVRLAAAHEARVLIVECKPGDEAEWRRRLETRAASGCADSDGGTGWHKPASWEELQRLVESYEGCFDYDTSGVAKLVVDTTVVDDGLGEAVEAVLRFLDSGSLSVNQWIEA